MRHLDLFSGIGGFALAAREVWGDAHEIAGFCDNDAFCQNVLAKNFPGVPIYGDIRELTAHTLRERLEGVTAKNDGDKEPVGKRGVVGVGPEPSNRIDLLTGGFPCQPFSNAGKKRGDKDDRFLWPEMLRVIRETRPAWIIGENVAGIINMALDQVCSELEGEGYEVQPFVIPAAAVNAPHRRDRVWIVGRLGAHTEGALDQCGEPGNIQEADEREVSERQEEWPTEPGDTDSDASNPGRERRSERSDEGLRPERQEPKPTHCRFSSGEWNRDWREVATATCHDRVDDGLSERLARLPDGSEISEARLRRESLKAYGNAIVPQVAVEIMRAIKAAN